MPLIRGVAALVADAKAGLEALNPAQVRGLLSSDDVVVVDLREHDELIRDGRIPGAIHVPRGFLEFVADPDHPMHNPALRPGRQVVLYCASGGRSALAARTLREMGYGRLAHLEGGLAAWKAQGGSVQGS